MLIPQSGEPSSRKGHSSAQFDNMHNVRFPPHCRRSAMHTAALSAAVRRLSPENERRSGFVVGHQALRRLL